MTDEHAPVLRSRVMVDLARKRASYAEYVAIANDSELKYEYAAGEIIAMSGGTVSHGRLIGQLSNLLNQRLADKACIVLPSDMRVRIRAADRSTYPDLYVVCGEPELATDDDHAIVNPTVIFEVLSDSSASSDRIDKFAAYRRLPSLREYVLVSQQERRIEVFLRDGRRWQFDEYGPGLRVPLPTIEVELAVDDIYVDRVGVIVG